MTKRKRKSQDVRWWQNPNIQSALITGVLGLVGTVITVRATRPPAPAPEPVEPQRAPQQASVDPSLNFAEFQKRITGLDDDEKARYFNPLVGRQMIWEGYVEAWLTHPQLIDGAFLTVSLVESPEKVTQSMFKRPALFRMQAKEFAAASALKPGDRVTLMGKLKSHNTVATILTEGHIVGAATNASTQTALGQTRSNLQ